MQNPVLTCRPVHDHKGGIRLGRKGLMRIQTEELPGTFTRNNGQLRPGFSNKAPQAAFFLQPPPSCSVNPNKHNLKTVPADCGQYVFCRTDRYFVFGGLPPADNSYGLHRLINFRVAR